MTNYKEEQELELEALTSIFEEGKEFEKVSDTEFKLKFKPFPNDEQENHVSVTMRIAYTDTYPETAPDWELQDAVMNDDKLKDLKSKIEETIESSLGMAMVYTVAEMCQEWLKENNLKELSMHEQMMKRQGGDEEEEEDDDEDIDDEEIDRLEEEEWKGLASKPEVAEKDRITVDLFNEWKKNFDLEMIALGTLKREESKGQSGKQYFLAQQAAAEDGSAKKDDAPLVYNAALFGEEDEDDLDDMSGDEEDEEEDKFFEGLSKDA